MKFTIFGFNQEKAIEYGLDIRDLLLIEYIWDMLGSPTMQHIIRDDCAYVWLMHDRILSDLPILNISKRSLIDYFNKLKDLGLISVITTSNEKTRGSKSYYTITNKCEELRYDQVQNFAVGQRPGAENCTSDNIKDISNTSNIVNQDISITSKKDTYINNKKENTEDDWAQKFVDQFNSICKSLPKCQKITPKRRKGIFNIIKKYDTSEILEVFRKLEASDFCTGRSGRWRADLDFILREDKFISVLEGKYDNQKSRCNVEMISQGDKKRLTDEERERIIKNGKKF